MKEKPIPYISNDNFSQEVIFHYWAGRLSGHAHVNQKYPDVVRMWRQNTLKASISTMLPTCDDKGVFTDDDDTYRKHK
jgi:hypothetical protein